MPLRREDASHSPLEISRSKSCRAWGSEGGFGFRRRVSESEEEEEAGTFRFIVGQKSYVEQVQNCEVEAARLCTGSVLVGWLSSEEHRGSPR